MIKRNKAKRRVTPWAVLMLAGVLCLAPTASAASVLADADPITIISSRISVKEALHQVSKQSGMNILFQSDIVDKEMMLTLDLRNVTMEKALDTICQAAGLRYTLHEDYVLITLQKKGNQAAVQTEVSGTVTDERGDPLGGVIVVAGSNPGTGVMTNAYGRYTLKTQSDDVLVFSFMGMRKHAEAVGNRTQVDVRMEEEVKMLSDVVVTGYQTISKERATGSFDIINQDLLEKPSSNITDRLIGKVAGLQTALSADGVASITIRGRGTLQSEQDPLVVVDGFPITAGFDAVNPNDVESIYILKDAAAASIWGARASNGVIVITTKKAKAGQPLRITFDAQVKLGSHTDLDYLRNTLSGDELIAYQRSMFDVSRPTFPTATPSTSEAFKAAYDNKYNQAGQLYGKYRTGTISESEFNSGLEALARLDNSRQIKDKMLQRPAYQQYSLSLSGSTARMSNYVSLLYGYNQSRYQGKSDDNLQMDYRGTAKLTQWLDLNLSLMTRFHKSTGNSYDINALAPYDMLLNADGSYTDMSYLKYYPEAVNFVADRFDFPYSDWSYNMLQDQQAMHRSDKTLNNRFQAGLTFHLIKGLDFDSKFLYEHLQQDVRNLYDEESYYVRDLINTFTTLDWSRVGKKNNAVAHIDQGAILKQSKSVTDAYNWRNQVNFNYVFADKHAINAVAGVEISQDKLRTTQYAPVYGYSNKYLTSSSIKETTVENCFGKTVIDGIPTNSSFGYTLHRYFSAFANIGYTFDEKYSLSGSYRTDASNFITDDPSYRYAPFWSVGMSWNMMHEGFMKPLHFIDYLKPRITYGCNGNANTTTSIVPLITMQGMNSMIGEYGATVATYGNPKMKWERTHIINFGTDFSFLKGRIYGKFDIYNKKGTDIMADVSVPIVSGMYKIGDKEVKITANAAEITNRGFEVELGSIQNIGKEFSWNGSVNVAYNKNKVDKCFVNYISTSDMSTGYYPVEGYSIYGLWAYEYAGMKGVNTADGTVNVPTVYIDKEGTTAVINAIPEGTDGRDALRYMGTTVAPWTVGMSHVFTYKEFNLSFTMTGKFGHKFRKTSFNFANPLYSLPNRQYRDMQHATSESRLTLPDNEYVQLNYYSVFEPTMSYNVASANHVRMQEVTFSYSLPKPLLSKCNISRLTLYLQANNLFTIKATDEDPEYAYGNLRLQPSYTLGAKFEF